MNEPKQPKGPHTKRLVDELEAMADRTDPAKAVGKLEHLGHSLLRAAAELKAGNYNAFDGFGPEDVETLFTLVMSHMLSADLLEAAQSLDAEGN